MEVDSVTDEVLSARTNDPYKSEGQIILKIEKFSEFAREKPGNRRLSDPVYIRGLPWNILAIAREMSSRSAGRRCLGYFLQCNLGDEDPSWSCSAKVALKILAQKPQEENHVRKVTHVFHAKENDWGYAQFMTFENIMDPEEGWYDEKEDTIILLVYVKADPPLGVKIDEERLKSLQGIKEKENEIEINNSDGNLIKIKEELENLKKSKEIYERLAQNANQLALINEENIKLKEENYNFARESEKNKFLIKQLENEKLKNLNEYEGEIEKIQSKVEELEKEKKYALDLYTNLEMKFEDFKNELNSENVSLKADNDRLKIQVMEQAREEGLTSLKLSTENKKVQSENDQLKEKLNDYEFVLAEYSVKHEDLKKSIDELNNQITSMNELAKMLREENSKLQTDRDILIKRVEEFEFLMDEYSVERGQFMETIETMKELIKNKEKELEEEKEKVEELNISNKNLEEEFNKIKTEHINLTAKNVKLNTKLENEDKLYCNDTSTSQQLSEPIKLFVPADIREVFPGRFLGPGGRSQRELELACRCKLKIDGKGVRNSTSEEEMHVIISPSKLSAYPDVSKAKSEVIKLFKLGLMDPERELQLAEVARIKKEELKKKKLAESERNEQKSREERLAFLEDIKKCQEEKDKELLESFKCSVCFEQFGSTYRVPVVASCSHTICYACVKRILEENQCFAEKNQFKCPRCRGQTPLGNVLKNYQLIKLWKQ